MWRMMLFLHRVWFDQIADRLNARAILERLCQMRWLDCRLAGQLGNALRNTEQPRDLDNGELEVMDGGYEQASASSIQLVTRTWPRPGLCRTCKECFISFTAPTMPVGDTRAMRSRGRLRRRCRPGARPGMRIAVATQSSPWACSGTRHTD